MDPLDDRLLTELSRDASRSTSALARTLGVARSTVQARIDRLTSSGVITGFTIRLGADFDRRRIRATVLLNAAPRSTAPVLARLKSMPEVESCHTSTGRVDLILRLVVDDTAALDQVLDRIGAIPGVTNTESLIQLSTKWDRRAGDA
ncbi:MAG: Lrp/AsnC family transcriptional regulator [Pseudomonadota bacterium]